jgi:hypothetical protein
MLLLLLRLLPLERTAPFVLHWSSAFFAIPLGVQKQPFNLTDVVPSMRLILALSNGWAWKIHGSQYFRSMKDEDQEQDVHGEGAISKLCSKEAISITTPQTPSKVATFSYLTGLRKTHKKRIGY